MKIALTQNEIKAAVRQYMVSEGFKLEGKIFDADFSMGKGERGLSAIVTIENKNLDTDIPGFTGAASDEEEAALKETSSVDIKEEPVQAGTVGAVITENAKEVVATTAKADEATAAPKAETKVEEPVKVPVTEPDVAEAGDAGIFD